MKIKFVLPMILLASTLAVFAQPQSPPPSRPSGPSGYAPSPQGLTRFDLDFHGGTPAELVAAIEQAEGRPLNAIIPPENAQTRLPALRMTHVDVPHLFEALQAASRKDEAHVSGTFYNGIGGPSQSYSVSVTYYGFKTEGPLSDDSIWYFHVDRPPFPPVVPTKACRFYLLTPYLDRGLTVDDITTAIRTGWKLTGDESTPTINFHKETRLLIAVGEPGKLDTIDAVLKALEPAKPKPDSRSSSAKKPATDPTMNSNPSE